MGHVRLNLAKRNSQLTWCGFVSRMDRLLPSRAASLGKSPWKGKVVFHSSGALSSRELSSLRKAGAFVASVHPMMSFVHHGAEATFEVPFALEGDAKALRVAKSIVRDLGGESLLISAANKPLYHAFGAFPLALDCRESGVGGTDRDQGGSSEGFCQAGDRPDSGDDGVQLHHSRRRGSVQWSDCSRGRARQFARIWQL